MNRIIIQIIVVGIVFALFLMATNDKVNARGVKQQVLEKEISLLIDSAIPGMSFEVMKSNPDGVVQSIELKEGRVFVSVAGLGSLDGYPYFSKYSVNIEEKEDKFIVRIL